jgi:hypothetical protein
MTTGARRSDQRLAQEELSSLSTEYAAAVDDRDGERLSELFVADGELVVPNFPDDLRPVITRSGHEALRRVPDGLRRYDRTFHQLSNHRYAIDGALASGEVQCVAHHVSVATGDTHGDGRAGTDVVWFILYHDDYRHTGPGWRFVRRELHLRWVEEHPIARMGVLGGTDHSL